MLLKQQSYSKHLKDLKKIRNSKAEVKKIVIWLDWGLLSPRRAVREVVDLANPQDFSHPSFCFFRNLKIFPQTDLSVGVLTVLLGGREVLFIWNLPANLKK